MMSRTHEPVAKLSRKVLPRIVAATRPFAIEFATRIARVSALGVFAAGFLFLAGPVQAGITYDFTTVTSAGGPYNPLSLTVGGLTLNVTAPGFTVTGQGSGTGGNGLGVTGGATSLVDLGESLQFDFTPSTVQLLQSVVFESFTPTNDTISATLGVYVNNAGSAATSRTFGGIVGTNTFNLDFTANNLWGSVFRFEDTAGSFRVKSITVVDEPTTLALLGLGLGLAALGLARRRQ